MKNFNIENTDKNLNWVNANLDTQDFKIEGNLIVIYYYNQMQRDDITSAIRQIN